MTRLSSSLASLRAWLAGAALPFFLLMVVAVLLIIVFPQVVLWLPGLM